MKKLLSQLTILLTLFTVSCSTTPDDPVPGAYFNAPTTDQDVVAAANYAVKAKGLELSEGDPSASNTLQLISIDKAEQQIVSGMNFRLHLSVQEGKKTRKAEAVVWWQAWHQAGPYQLTSWKWHH